MSLCIKMCFYCAYNENYYIFCFGTQKSFIAVINSATCFGTYCGLLSAQNSCLSFNPYPANADNMVSSYQC